VYCVWTRRPFCGLTCSPLRTGDSKFRFPPSPPFPRRKLSRTVLLFCNDPVFFPHLLFFYTCRLSLEASSRALPVLSLLMARILLFPPPSRLKSFRAVPIEPQSRRRSNFYVVFSFLDVFFIVLFPSFQICHRTLFFFALRVINNPPHSLPSACSPAPSIDFPRPALVPPRSSRHSSN